MFQRYVDFCNEAVPKADRQIVVSDLEFVHCHVLNGSDTAESSALMKNDRIRVRRERTTEREAEQERKRLQREADRNFFQQMRYLMPDMASTKFADVIIDCMGKLADESGRNQQVLRSTVKAHSVLLKKRCPFLAGKIASARIQADMEAQMEARLTPERDEGMNEDKANIVSRVESDVRSVDEESDGDMDDDDDSAVVSFPQKEKQEAQLATGAAEIEIDDDDDDDASLDGSRPRNIPEDSRPSSPAIVPTDKATRQAKQHLRITLNHSPEAVKLLLEYCYTNRVGCLGQEAFMQACKTKPQKHAGPIAPYPISASGSRRWPKNGFPTVPFDVAIAGIVLAEEAGLPRLSIMCEVAASQLLTHANVFDALAQCAAQKSATGNDLPRLRKGAMSLIFRNGKRGVLDLERLQPFRRGYQARRAVVIPILMQGTLEAVGSNEKILAAKRERNDWKMLQYDVEDTEDKFLRDRERKKRRIERIENDPSRQNELIDYEIDDIYDDFRGWAQEAPKRSLKRMAKHLEAMTNRTMARYSYSHGGGGSSGNHRRSSGSRRRTSTISVPKH